LDRGVRGVRRVDRPERRDHVGVDRLEERRLAAPRRMPGGLDRARELRPLELVGEGPRRLPGPCLDEVEGESEENEAEERDRGEEAVEARPPAHSAVLPRMTRGSRSISRRTKWHVTPASVHAST